MLPEERKKERKKEETSKIQYPAGVSGRVKMKTNIKVFKVCPLHLGWMILKLNNHDMIMVSLCKACIDFPG